VALRVRSVQIKGVGGIRRLDIRLNDRMNILCGPNGIGKTTVLECIAHAFSVNSSSIIKRNAQSQSGGISGHVEIDDNLAKFDFSVNSFLPGLNQEIRGLYEHAGRVLSLKVSRTFSYESLDAVTKDKDKSLHSLYEEAKLGIDIKDVKAWFVNRYLYSAHGVQMSKWRISNSQKSVSLFSIRTSHLVVFYLPRTTSW
jgi:predicted ATP-dependent endonuclease of OLD family